MEHVTIARQDRIATVRFDTGHKANALSLALMRELTDVARSFEDDSETSAIILAGRSDCFSMGFDLKDPETQALRVAPLAQQRIALDQGARMCRAWEELAPLAIAAIDGWCLGGGLALAASCDLRVATQAGTLALPEIERGFTLSWGTIPRIVNLIGPARAKRMILLAESLTAQQAEAWGLVDAVTEDSGAMAAAEAFAKTAEAMPPGVLRMGKRSINAYANALTASATHADAELFALALNSEDGAEGFSAFAEARTPRFTGK